MKRTLGIVGALLAVAMVLAWAAPDSGEENTAADARAARRSFTGAPPVIPHKVYWRNNKECLHCHLEVRQTPFGLSNITPHPELKNCQQCHVGTQWLNGEVVVPLVKNTFEGWDGEGKGTRTHEFAPPTVPHSLHMRQNCNSCHAPDAPDPRLRGPHPKRINCRQCHVQENPEFLLNP